jgi:3'-5' exoribonuclease 1
MIVFDLETAGEPENRVVEIGAVRLDQDFKIVDEYTSLVDGRPVLPKVTAIHGITNDMLVGKPKFAEMHSEFEEWCSKSKLYILAAWGAYFDMPVLRAEYDRIGVKFPHPGHAFDPKMIVWWEVLRRGLPAQRLTVDRACQLLGIPFDGTRHRGLPDARTEAKLLMAVARPGRVA